MIKIHVIESFLGQKRRFPAFQKGLAIYLNSDVILIQFEPPYEVAICQSRDPSQDRSIYQTHITGLHNKRELHASCDCSHQTSPWCEHALASLMKISEYIRLEISPNLPQRVVGHFNPLAYKEIHAPYQSKDQAVDKLALPPSSSPLMPSSG